jgi:sodium/bile acid cotransporter 7
MCSNISIDFLLSTYVIQSYSPRFPPIKDMRSLLTRHWFILAFLACLLASRYLPALPAGPWQSALKMALVAAIFFFSGMGIRSHALLSGLGHWRLHLFIQVFSLLVTVMMCRGLDPVWERMGLDPSLRFGFLLLGALPTTVTSCVALTAAAGGNRVAAVVNASLGNLLGVFITPMWLVLFANMKNASVDIGPVVEKLCLLVLLPLAVGQVVQFILGDRLSDPVRKRLSSTGQVLLLGILYISFQKAFAVGLNMDAGTFITAVVICSGLHAVWLFLPWVASAWPMWRMDAADRRCALICSSQKTLAFGLPLLNICFPTHPDLPILSLPLLIYHPLQLFVAAALVPRLAASLPVNSSEESIR